jgi:multicomponent Na+:H+ antiporter subunit E
MKLLIIIFILLLSFWILLSGFDIQELVTGATISIIVLAIIHSLFKNSGKNYTKRFFYLLAYIPYYIIQEIKCNADVIYRIITGKIDPAIVEVPNEHKNDFGTTILANSITMTPGTLALEVGKNSIFVHWLYAKGDKNKISKTFEKILTKVWD